MHAVDVDRVHLVPNNSPSSSERVVEVPVLLDAKLLTALEAAACQRGMSAGCVVRRLIRDFLAVTGGEP